MPLRKDWTRLRIYFTNPRVWRLWRPCPDCTCRLKGVFFPPSLPGSFRTMIMIHCFCVPSVPVGLCCCCTRIIVLFYLCSKDLIKVSGLTQQPLVNLATFSHSPTHDLSIFLLHCTASRSVRAAQRCAVIEIFQSSEFFLHFFNFFF